MDQLPGPLRSRMAVRVAALAIGLALVATPLAATGAAAQGNTYTGCVSQGSLFFVAIGMSPYQPCTGASLIRWNQRGAKGATGQRGQRGRRGPRGEQGAQGPRGQQGPRGPVGSNAELRTYSASAQTSGADERLLQVMATCDEGDLATGGGFQTDGLILASLGVGEPSPTAWQAIAQANADATDLEVSVICADLPPLRSGGGS